MSDSDLRSKSLYLNFFRPFSVLDNLVFLLDPGVENRPAPRLLPLILNDASNRCNCKPRNSRNSNSPCTGTGHSLAGRAFSAATVVRKVFSHGAPIRCRDPFRRCGKYRPSLRRSKLARHFAVRVRAGLTARSRFPPIPQTPCCEARCIAVGLSDMNSLDETKV